MKTPKYILEENQMGIKSLKLELNGDSGILEFEKDKKVRKIEFGIIHY